MRVAILGATSMLAADYVATAIDQGHSRTFTLFARDPARAREAMARRGVAVMPAFGLLDDFAGGSWDAIVNFIGVGDPARAVAMGAHILTVTRAWDERILSYLDEHPTCRYLFLSSGVALGIGHAEAIGPDARACFDINHLAPSAFYGIAKFYAEAVHRSRSERSIIDLRIFNYFSEFADPTHRFFVNEIVDAIATGRTLSVDDREMWRDYIGRDDLTALVSACLDAPTGYNAAVDAYSRAPISKQEMLDLFEHRFGLSYAPTGGGIDATGTKSIYFSRNDAARALGYQPHTGSAETLEEATRRILSRRAAPSP